MAQVTATGRITAEVIDEIEINNISDSINQKFKVQENSKYVYSVSLTSNIIINNSPDNDTLMIKPNINKKDFDINCQNNIFVLTINYN